MYSSDFFFVFSFTVAYVHTYRLHIWPLSVKNEGGPWTEKWPVSHTEEITCFVITYDSLQIITGSKDMSLKVWQINGGKLSQVRVHRCRVCPEKFLPSNPTTPYSRSSMTDVVH